MRRPSREEQFARLLALKNGHEGRLPLSSGRLSTIQDQFAARQDGEKPAVPENSSKAEQV